MKQFVTVGAVSTLMVLSFSLGAEAAASGKLSALKARVQYAALLVKKGATKLHRTNRMKQQVAAKGQAIHRADVEIAAGVVAGASSVFGLWAVLTSDPAFIPHAPLIKVMGVAGAGRVAFFGKEFMTQGVSARREAVAVYEQAEKKVRAETVRALVRRAPKMASSERAALWKLADALER